MTIDNPAKTRRINASKTRTGHFWQPAVGCIDDDLQQLLDTPAPDRGDDPELGKIGAD